MREGEYISSMKRNKHRTKPGGKGTIERTIVTGILLRALPELSLLSAGRVVGYRSHTPQILSLFDLVALTGMVWT
jgi:hypothetical protein